MNEIASPDLLTYLDVARRLGCCVKHVRDAFVKTGKLKAVHLGPRAVRFRPQDVDQLVGRLMGDGSEVAS